MVGLPVNPMAGGVPGADPWSWLLELFSQGAPGASPPGNMVSEGHKPYYEGLPGGGDFQAQQTGPNASGMAQNIPGTSAAAPPIDLTAGAAAAAGYPGVVLPGAAGVPMPGLDSPLVPGMPTPSVETLPQAGGGLDAGSPLPSSMGEALGTTTPNTTYDAATGTSTPVMSDTDKLKQALGAIKAPEAPQGQRISSPNAPQARPLQSGLLELLLASKTRAAEQNPMLRLSQLLGRGG